MHEGREGHQTEASGGLVASEGKFLQSSEELPGEEWSPAKKCRNLGRVCVH